jgi:hypothetical protein
MASTIDSSVPPPIKVAVVGGGLGGLSATLSILKLSIDKAPLSADAPLSNSTASKPNETFAVTCYERDAAFTDRRNGYGLTLTYNPKGPFGKLGLLEKVARHDTPSRSHYVFDSAGKILGYYGKAFHPTNSVGGGVIKQRGNMRVPRQTLRRILLDEVASAAEKLNLPQNEVVAWGKDLVSYEVDPAFKTEGKLKLHFADGTAVGAVDVLVGADGVRSSVMKNLLLPTASSSSSSSDTPQSNREKLNLPSADGQYFGVMIVLGITNFQHPLLHERGFYTLSGDARLFTMPFGGGVISGEVETTTDESSNGEVERKTMWQLSFSVPSLTVANELRSRGPQALKDEVLRVVADWHDPVARMVASTSNTDIWGTPLLDRAPLPINKKGDKGRVVCLGKAFVECFELPFYRSSYLSSSLILLNVRMMKSYLLFKTLSEMGLNAHYDDHFSVVLMHV